MVRFLLVAGSAAALAACGPQEPIRIGIVLDAEGIVGAEVAADDINATGGIRGRLIRLSIAGDESGKVAPLAVPAAEAVASDPGVLAVVGHTNSSASLAAAQIYNERAIVQIAPTSTAPVFSEAGPYSFRLVAGDQHQGAFLARVVAEDHPRRIVVLYVNDDYGRAIHQSFVRELADRGLTPVHQAPYLEGQRFADVDVIARSVVDSRPDLLVWLGREPELRILMSKVKLSLDDLRILASDGFSAARLHEPGGDLLVGVRYVRLQDPLLDSPRIQRVRASFREKIGGESTDQMLLAYVAVELLAHAIAETGAGRERIREFLSGLGSARPAFQSVLGPITFDAQGDAPPHYFLMEVTPKGSRPAAGPVTATR